MSAEDSGWLNNEVAGIQEGRKPKVLLIHLEPLFQVPDPLLELLVRELK